MTQQKEHMINIMADVIGLDDKYMGNKLNDDTIWQQFMNDIMKRIDDLSDKDIQESLHAVDIEEFQKWIDDPNFWMLIDQEIKRRGELVKTMIYPKECGNC